MAATAVERSASYPPHLESPRRARQLLREVLEGCGRAEWSEPAELALTELATNAVLHAHSDFRVTVLCSDDALRVEVEDASRVIPQQRTYGAHSATGRGLALVSAVAHEHGFRRTATGKVVWFVLDDDPPEPSADDLDALLDAWADAELQDAAPDRPERTVTLVGFPPTLWLATVQMHDALLRELALFRAGLGMDVKDLAAADRARFAVRATLDRALADERVKAQARSPLPPGHPAQLAEVPPVLDLELPVWPEAAADMATLQDVLDEANRLAAQGQFLTRPSLPEIVALRDWVAEQVISSLSGQAPMAWGGADAERFTQRFEQEGRDVGYDVAVVVDGPRSAIVVDAQNRILGISAALADETGWAVDDLVGRRVVALVPPRFREAHVAGLTRHLSTGQAHALRVDLQLPVLRADGSEVLCDFWIDADRTRSGVPVYIAYVSPAATRAEG